MSKLMAWAGGVVSCLVAHASGETIGPWEVTAAPTSAVKTQGGGFLWSWLNDVNMPVTVSQAFSGFSIIADGYANADLGTTIETTFAPGALVNVPGVPDLVMFEARFSAGAYTIRTSYDAFSAELALPASNFSWTGLTRTYYYGLTGLPDTAQVWAAPIDLSDLGVPNGVAVTKVRFRTSVNGADPLGLGTIVVPAPGAPAVIGAAGLLAGIGRRRRGRRT